MAAADRDMYENGIDCLTRSPGCTHSGDVRQQEPAEF